MIIQIRGTSGSGKSTVMRWTMDRLAGVAGWTPRYVEGRKKPLLYHTEHENRIVVLGHYESPCGGCDTIGSAAAVYEQIKSVIEGNGDVPILCEGLLLSEDTKWTKQLKEEGHDVRVIFLTTPLERCLEQIKGRRAAVGNDKELNPLNTRNRVATIERARVKLVEAGVICRRCSSTQAPELIQTWIEGGI